MDNPNDTQILEQLLHCFRKCEQRITYKLGINSDYKECQLLYLKLIALQKQQKNKT